MHKIDGKTQLVGIIGWPVSHSFSPTMHNAAFADLGLNWKYVPLPVKVEDVKTAVSALPSLGFKGVNVTVPHKQTVIPLLDEIEPGAKAIGAVNTIVVHQNNQTTKLVGHNTDWTGFLADIASLNIAIPKRDCLVLGAGGSARAVAYALAQAGGRVTIFARRPEQAHKLVTDLQPHLPKTTLQAQDMNKLETAVPEPAKTAVSQSPISNPQSPPSPLIINTTPLGMTPHTNHSIWPKNLPFPTGAFVYDLVYNPPETKFMRQARAQGCQAANGLGMLLHQGAQAFKLWTGKDASIEVMQKALVAFSTQSV